MINWLDAQAVALLDLLFPLMIRSIPGAVILIVVSFLARHVELRVVKWTMMAGLVLLLIPPFIPAPGSGPIAVITSASVFNVIPAAADAPGMPGPGFHWIVLLYPGVVLCMLAVIGWNTLRVHRRYRHAQPLTVGDVPMPANVRIVRSVENHSPFLVGLRNPVIVVPAVWSDWSKEERLAVLHHELGHLEHRDNWSVLLIGLINAVYFFNPLTWIMTGRFRLVQELLADRYARRQDRSGATGFARQLVRVAGTLKDAQVRAPGLALTEPYRRLVHRVNYLFWERKETRMTSKWIRSFTMIALVAAGFALISLRGGPVQAAEAMVMADDGGEDVVVEPKATDIVQPKYPKEAAKQGISGFVVFRVTVNEKGQIEEIKLLKSSHELLTEPARLAVAQWTFEPGTRNGKPATLDTHINVYFRLDKGEAKTKSEAPPKPKENK